MSQRDTGFASRLAYIRWLRGRGHPNTESDQELADATGVGYPWLSKWKRRSDSPNDRVIAATFVRGLGLTPAQGTWLLDGHGEPIEPDQWRLWNERPASRRLAQLESLADAAPIQPRGKKARVVGRKKGR